VPPWKGSHGVGLPPPPPLDPFDRLAGLFVDLDPFDRLAGLFVDLATVANGPNSMPSVIDIDPSSTTGSDIMERLWALLVTTPRTEVARMRNTNRMVVVV
jgi:hypothetical protein